MKAILKTIKLKDNLDYTETFNSPKNINIRSKLISELRKSMALNFRPSVAQLTNWMNSIHKSQRSQAKLKASGKINKDSWRVHNNNRVQDVIIKIKISIFFSFIIYMLIIYANFILFIILFRKKYVE